MLDSLSVVFFFFIFFIFFYKFAIAIVLIHFPFCTNGIDTEKDMGPSRRNGVQEQTVFC